MATKGEAAPKAGVNAPVAVPPALRRSAFWWLRSAAVVVALYYGWLLLGVVRHALYTVLDVVMLFVFGLVVAMLVQPLVELLERRLPVSRAAAALVVLLGVLGVVILVGYALASPLVTEATGLSSQLPTWVSSIEYEYAQAAGWLRWHGVDVHETSLLAAAGGSFGGQIAGIVLGVVRGAVTIAIDAVVVLVTAFWLLKDGAVYKRAVLMSLPAPLRTNVAFVFEAVAAVVGGYARAQLVIAVMIGGLAGVGSWLLGVPYPIVVGLSAGIFELVPIVGPFAGGAVGITLALTVSPLLALWTLLLFVGIHILEGYILAPRIQATFTKIPEFVAFLAIFAGVEVGGLVGALFAVPVASLAFIFVRAAVGDLKADHPELFEGGGPVMAERRRRLVRELNHGWFHRLRDQVRRRRVAG